MDGIEDTIVAIVGDPTYLIMCLGATVSADTVLTTCSCFGAKEIVVGDYVVVDKDVTTRRVKNVFLHTFCRRTEFDDDLFIYDLAAVKLMGRAAGKNAFYNEIDEISGRCWTVVVPKNFKKLVLREISYRNESCLEFYCEKPSCLTNLTMLPRNSLRCGLLNETGSSKTILNEVIKGKYLNLNAEKTDRWLPGSPLFCSSVLTGLVSSGNRTFFWTNLGSTENRIFLSFVLNKPLRSNQSNQNVYFLNPFLIFFILYNKQM